MRCTFMRIEQCLLLIIRTGYSAKDKEFKITNLEAVFNLDTDDGDEFNRNIVELFFKLLLAYIEKKYGKLSNKKDFL